MKARFQEWYGKETAGTGCQGKSGLMNNHHETIISPMDGEVLSTPC